MAKRAMTRREREIELLSKDIEELTASREAAAISANKREKSFVSLAIAKGFSNLARHGWPDFFGQAPDNRFVGVEVKSANDDLSEAQQVMFAMLNEAGVPVYVWWESIPDRLIPWRTFWEKRAKLRLETKSMAEPQARPTQFLSVTQPFWPFALRRAPKRRRKERPPIPGDPPQ